MQSIFNRRENKYLVTMEQGAVLQRKLTQYMTIDRHGEYLVQNLYFDTDDWEIIRESIERPMYKEKLRLRFYGQKTRESHGFLELKKKFHGITYKRRIDFPLCELESRSIREIVSSLDSQISREIIFFMQRKEISEKIYIAYARIAYNGIGDGDLRITFDKDVFFRLISFNNYDSGENRQILKPNQMIMEIKTTGAMPLWLAKTLSENSIFPVPFSKFGVCYTGYIGGMSNVA
ncbi:MAG: polyphosphate polymerase domain-containing protein [Treponema sp.]|jgi:SPX domain protein involved in polyphosphate accumulation|nr:polyphosphate polymerase domain-containing protein [Treponema sp.]